MEAEEHGSYTDDEGYYSGYSYLYDPEFGYDYDDELYRADLTDYEDSNEYDDSYSSDEDSEEQGETISQVRLPAAGKTAIIIISTVTIFVIAVISFIRIRCMKDIK